VQWRALDVSDNHKKVNGPKIILLKDYEQLVERAEVILERCSKGMDVIMNNAMLAESKRAILQAQSVAKLTLIAFFYIPLYMFVFQYGYCGL
jgi:hypothetical protein